MESLSEIKKVLEGREECVAFVGLIDGGQIEFGAGGEEFLIKSSAADDEDFWGIGTGGGKVGKGANESDSVTRGEGGTEDDVLASGKRSADGFEGGAAHEDGVTEGGALEELEVFGEVPRKGAVATDDAVGGHGDDGGEKGGAGWHRVQAAVRRLRAASAAFAPMRMAECMLG